MILDLGCGANPHGDVNLDIGPRILAAGPETQTKADVWGNVYALPFADESFEVVHWIGLLHHLSDPARAWREIVRVSKDLIIGEEPTFLNPFAYFDPHHTYRGFRQNQLLAICQGTPHLRLSLHVPTIKQPWALNWQILAMKRHP
jgi:SAM-dependent methyltransferase